MTKYLVNGQGYGGGGPSVSPFESTNLEEIKERIAELLESDHAVQLYKIDENAENFLSDNLILMAARLSRNVKAKAIVGITSSGFTGFRLASHRPSASVFVFTRNKNLITQMSLVWGVRAYLYSNQVSTDATFEDIENTLKKDGHVSSGDVIINTASMPLAVKGRTNMLKLHVVG